MSYRILSYLAALAVVITCPAVYAYSGGTGEPNDPYLIGNKADLLQLSATPTDCNCHFAVIADIDLAGETFLGAVLWPATESGPGPFFTGVFDGQDHVISSLKVRGGTFEGPLGLFGAVGSGGLVRNVVLKDCDTYSTWPNAYKGGLVGSNDGGLIEDCGVSGSVKGSNSFVGGIVGCNNGGTVDRCRSSANVVAFYSGGAGSVCGLNYATITRSYATGDVSAPFYAGGLVASNSGVVADCYAFGAVTGQTNIAFVVGGLVGRNAGSITRSYSTGFVTTFQTTPAGGLVAYSVGGVVTDSFWNMESSGATGSWGGTGLTTAQMHDPNTYLNAGWDFTGETANGTADTWSWPGSHWYPVLSAVPSHIPADTIGEGTALSPYRISDMNELYLVSCWPAAHYVLTSDIDLAGRRYMDPPIVPGFCTGDSDSRASGFRGVFDAQGHTITGLSINEGGLGTDYLGLFGRLQAGGVIRGLHLEACKVVWTGQSYMVGGLVGESLGTIEDCTVSGQVAGAEYVGGLAGSTYTGSSTSRCHAAVNVTGSARVGGLIGHCRGSLQDCSAAEQVTGSSYVGGLAGMLAGNTTLRCHATGNVAITSSYGGGLCGYIVAHTIQFCYARGNVTGGSWVAGLVGNMASGTLTDCYSTGAGTSYDYDGLIGYVSSGTVTASFWDKESSGCLTSAAGIGKTTAEMKTLATFTSVGWDFLGETANGTSDDWRMCLDGVDYPHLTWEHVKAGDFACPDGVSFDDLAVLINDWLLTYPSPLRGADASGDGFVNFLDFATLAANYMEGM